MLPYTGRYKGREEDVSKATMIKDYFFHTRSDMRVRAAREGEHQASVVHTRWDIRLKAVVREG